MAAARRRELFEDGISTNLATADPKKLQKLLHDPNAQPEATGMIAIPKRRSKPPPEGGALGG